MRVSVLGDPDGLGGRIAGEFGSSAMGLSDGPPADCDGVVIVVGADPAPVGRDLVDLPEPLWRDGAERAPWRALRALQRAHESVVAKSGNIVIITPSIGMVGAAHLTPYVTGIEAVRAMAKSAARQWALEGISVSQIAIPLGLLVTDVDHLERHVGSPSRKDADLSDAVVRAVGFLLSGAGPALTGSTLVVDGGAVMVP